jgi:hypothetical protein
MTEEEAKRKWCPFARTADAEVAGYNRTGVLGANLDDVKCLGSDCMAWRWMPRPLETMPSDGSKIEPWGYCGLVAKP